MPGYLWDGPLERDGAERPAPGPGPTIYYAPGVNELATGPFEITFLPHGRSARVSAGATLMDAAILCGVWVDAPCGGEGRCGKCLVRADGELAPPSPAEIEHVSPARLSEGWRLACQACITGPCTVDTGPVPSWAAAKSGFSRRGPLGVDLPSLPTDVKEPAGAAVDVGTTTLCVSLVDLRSGVRMGISSAENPQTRFGADVMTRIERCRNDGAASSEMHREVTESTNLLLREVTTAAGVEASRVVRVVMVGNTTMLHLALGEDPSPLGSYPFEPAVRGPVRTHASTVGLEALPSAELLVPAVLSGFLGADIVAVILSSGAAESDAVTLMVDLGTNGEIALASRRRIAACSTAAGPAFEGAQISSGMRAIPGAIESMSRDGLFVPGVLGGGAPLGICGSGLLDAVAALLEQRIIAPSGRLIEPAAAEAVAPGRVRQTGSMREFVLAPGTDITLTQEDIRQLQLAKGAIGAGVDVLCSRLGVTGDLVENVYLAGVFGSFLKPAAAVAAGLFPAQMKDRIEFAGNAALDGAELMLASDGSWKEALRLAGSVEVVELSGDPEFEKAFIDRLSFPGEAPRRC